MEHDEPGYIRGTSTPSLDGRHAGLVALTASTLALAALTVALAISAAGGNPANSALRSHGQPVKVTVTSCSAISSGIGQLIQFYDCNGSYTLDGKSYEAPIRGERNQIPVGAVLDAVAAPGYPPLLALPGTFSADSPQWWPTVASGIAALTIAALTAWFWRRRPGSAPSDPI